jgi:hypothetical protein
MSPPFIFRVRLYRLMKYYINISFSSTYIHTSTLKMERAVPPNDSNITHNHRV